MMLCFGSYTWKIYAKKVLNMGSTYTFWRQLNKDQKKAKERYIQLFYNLLFKNLVCFFGALFAYNRNRLSRLLVDIVCFGSLRIAVSLTVLKCLY